MAVGNRIVGSNPTNFQSFFLLFLFDLFCFSLSVGLIRDYSGQMGERLSQSSERFIFNVLFFHILVRFFLLLGHFQWDFLQRIEQISQNLPPPKKNPWGFTNQAPTPTPIFFLLSAQNWSSYTLLDIKNTTYTLLDVKKYHFQMLQLSAETNFSRNQICRCYGRFPWNLRQNSIESATEIHRIRGRNP